MLGSNTALWEGGGGKKKASALFFFILLQLFCFFLAGGLYFFCLLIGFFFLSPEKLKLNDSKANLCRIVFSSRVKRGEAAAARSHDHRGSAFSH